MKTLLIIAILVAVGAANSPYELSDAFEPLPSASETLADARASGLVGSPEPTATGGDVSTRVRDAASGVTATLGNAYRALTEADTTPADAAVPHEPGSAGDLKEGLSNIASGALQGLSDTVGAVRGDAAAAVADEPVGVSTPPEQPAASGSAVRGDVAAALKVITRDDAGTYFGAARWAQDTVGVHVHGAAADAAAVGQVDEVLAWLSAQTGVNFVRGAGDDMVVTLTAGASPRADARVRDGRYVAAAVTWDPTHPHATRWAYEELAQATGVFGDHGPVGSVLSTDQSASRPSDFDAWTLAALYDAADLSDASVEAALRASR